MRRKLLSLVVAALLLSPLPALAQIGQTATLTGTVTDATGAILPGATVTVTGESLMGGSRSVTTDANGSYRFPALPPGRYKVTAELPSFKKWEQDGVRLELGQTIALDPKLEVGGITDLVTVTGESPQVDVRSSAAQKNLTTDVMENIPFTSRFGPGAMLLSPGVNPNNYSSYGSGGSSSNAYMIDGVDVSDPEGGTIWVFANHNWIQEVQVIGLGANAEYGGFTGVASNSLFRSGSNLFKGLFETLYENDGLTDKNVTDEILEQNEDLTPGKTHFVTDSTFQIGGPIIRDKAWFFTSFQYYRPKTAPAGYPPTPPPGYAVTGIGPEAREEKSPRFLFKPTIKLSDSDQLTGFFETDSYTVDGRGISARVATEAGVHQDSPEVAWNGNYTKVLSSSSVFDVKYSGFWGYYYLSPYNGDDTPGWFDTGEDFFAVNSYYFYNADRMRHQANASVTKFASGFAGEHNLKFGAEFERSYIKSELGYPGGMLVYASYGVPYYASLWDGYLKDSINTRWSAFAQDSWTVGSRLTINPGVRFDRYTGFLKHLDDQVFATTVISPRIGFAWDATGDSRTVVRGHYGWYADGAKSSYYDLLDPQRASFFGAELDANANIVGEPYLTAPGGTSHSMDDDIKHPRLKQAIVGIERDLWKGVSLGVTGIWRDNDRFIDDVIQTSLSDYETFTLADPGPDGVAGTGDETGSTITVYDQVTDPADNRFVITNPDSAFRRYRGVEFSATKRMSNRWQMQASWVISKITGNYNNTGSFGNTSEYDSPNTNPELQPLRDGRLTNDNTHIAKLLGSYRAPWDVLVSAAYFYTSGQTFSRLVRTPGLGQGRLDMFIEERGSQRFDDQPRLDMKIEKQFRIGDRRLGFTFEGFNLLNDSAITNRTVRSGSAYFTPLGLVQARRLRVGAVYRF
ncbi:MAG TPA: TonB-dependent receptor [Vicinamibacterales bacterium]|nr:TonB-dependent receptor [Vicinamibacterales bacterium]